MLPADRTGAASGAAAPASAPRRRVSFHIGPQKTGSTSLHRHLRINAARLAGLVQVRVPQPRTVMEALGRAAIGYSLTPDPQTEARLRSAIAELRADLEQDGVPPLPALVSHENLIGAMPGNGTERALYPMAPRIVRMLDQGFDGWAVDYVLTPRAMPEWLPSVWAQAVRTDGYTGTWQAFAAETAGLPDWPDLIARLVAAVGEDRIASLPLDPVADATRPAAALLAHLGLPPAEVAALEAIDTPGMVRLNSASTELIRQLNGLPINPHARLKVVNLIASNQHLFNPDLRPEGTL